MNSLDAIKKFSTKLSENFIDFAVNIDDSYVFFGEALEQPIFVSDSEIRGLNPHNKADKKILSSVWKKIKQKDII